MLCIQEIAFDRFGVHCRGVNLVEWFVDLGECSYLHLIHNDEFLSSNFLERGGN